MDYITFIKLGHGFSFLSYLELGELKFDCIFFDQLRLSWIKTLIKGLSSSVKPGLPLGVGLNQRDPN